MRSQRNRWEVVRLSSFLRVSKRVWAVPFSCYKRGRWERQQRHTHLAFPHCSSRFPVTPCLLVAIASGGSYDLFVPGDEVDPPFMEAPRRRRRRRHRGHRGAPPTDEYPPVLEAGPRHAVVVVGEIVDRGFSDACLLWDEAWRQPPARQAGQPQLCASS
jgi:hypothetical protein